MYLSTIVDLEKRIKSPTVERILTFDNNSINTNTSSTPSPPLRLESIQTPCSISTEKEKKHKTSCFMHLFNKKQDKEGMLYE